MSYQDGLVRVSAIIPAYNAEATIAQTITSALAQNYPRLEIIVVDDGSRDGTARIAAGFGTQVRVVTQVNRGPAAARNHGARIANGSLLAFLDADDVWLGGMLERTTAALEANSCAVLAFGEFHAVNEAGEGLWSSRLERAPSLDRLLSGGWPVMPSGSLLWRSAFEQAGGFPENFTRPGLEDTYLWLRLRELGEFAYVAAPVVNYQFLPYAERSVKYGAARSTFIRMVRERYGRRADGLVGDVHAAYASGLMQVALQRMDRGERLSALGALIKLAGTNPRFLLAAVRPGRILRRQNFRRLAGLLPGLGGDEGG
jgi:glycosyltransferase involved in cell wall biosynthesis